MECDKKARFRGENWTQEEKEVLLEIMKTSAAVIENKNTDTNSNKKKASEWRKVQNQFSELTGKSRELEQIKGYWRRLKITAKKKVSAHKRAMNATGGGQKPPSPSVDDEKVIEVCPTDFVVEENIFDSDGVLLIKDLTSTNSKEEKENKGESSVIIYDCELSEDELRTEGATSEAQNIITIADVHNGEVTHADINTKYFKTPKSSKPKKKNYTPLTEKNFKADTSHKGAIVDMNIEMKRLAMDLMKQEHELKMKYHMQELANQEMRNNIEMQILNEKLKLYKKKNELEDIKNRQSF